MELVTTVPPDAVISGEGEPEAARPAAVTAATGDFEAFYRANADTVRRALAVTLGDVHVAAEATDEAMTRALARWRRVSTHESPAGWVYRVGLNWAISRWRRLRRETPLADGGTRSWRRRPGRSRPDDGASTRPGPADGQHGAGPPGAAGVAGIGEGTVDPPDPEAAAAGAALRRLPLDQRAVIVCRVLLECSTAETAALLEIPVGTVKSRLARGLAALRAALDPGPTPGRTPAGSTARAVLGTGSGAPAPDPVPRTGRDGTTGGDSTTGHDDPGKEER